MASTNQSPFYQKAESNYLNAKDPEDKLMYLEEMIKECPKHKSSEKMLSNLKNRYRKLKESIEKQKKSGKSSSSKSGIKKAEMQAIILGFPNTGKSTIFNLLTNKNIESKISPIPFTTLSPLLGTVEYENTKIQLIDLPPFPTQNKSLIYNTDTILLVIDDLNQIPESLKQIEKTKAKLLLIHNKIDLMKESEIRKIEATLKSKYRNLDYILFSKELTPLEIEKIKQTIFSTFPVIRIYTKEPKKPATKEPMILKKDSNLQEAAEKILKGMSKKVSRARIWGPSSKFSGQVVGLEHKLKDKDVVEFQVK